MNCEVHFIKHDVQCTITSLPEEVVQFVFPIQANNVFSCSHLYNKTQRNDLVAFVECIPTVLNL